MMHKKGNTEIINRIQNGTKWKKQIEVKSKEIIRGLALMGQVEHHMQIKIL